ncbi:hypothetical protein [Lacrimispora sp.]|uniref:hypothetical protein n=1 Tax=Lacrimispora sp. TaxID=2719234 RepID=UPI00345F4A45
MFQYVYPQFQFKSLLRGEMLEQLRDYPKYYLQLSFSGFAEGVVSGCELSWDNGKLTVGPGMVYRGGHLYFMKEPYSLECEPDNRRRYLKLQFLTEMKELRQVSGNTRIVLAYEAPDPACEMELCRFCLQEGARLRDKHENFEDFSTEFDTINLIYAPYAGGGMSTLNPMILRKYARETFQNKTKDPYDVSFSMNVLANKGVIEAECILEYLRVKLEGEVRDQSIYGMYRGLLKVLREQEQGGGRQDKEYQGRRSVMLL